MSDLETYYRIWTGEGKGPLSSAGYPQWPVEGIALVGDFSGIQTFVFRPIPGAGGAARRLRSRSFRVAAYTEIANRWCLRQLTSAQATSLYSVGGRFLISVRPFEGWEGKVAEMQAQIDAWAWEAFEGELAFHLGAAPFKDSKIPVEALRSALESRRRQPLQYALQSSGKWSEGVFFRAAAAGDGKCDACGMTQEITRNPDGKDICEACSADEQLGSKLTKANFAQITSQSPGVINAVGMSLSTWEDYTMPTSGTWLSFGQARKGTEAWYLLRHLPVDAMGHPLDFDDIAGFSPGPRKWLGYLRIDADGAGRQFQRLDGDPARTWALSRFLHLFFAKTANDLLTTSRYKNIYAVYGGGDDLFAIGPWADTLDFAVELRGLLAKTTGDALTFSAGMALAKPREHILTQAELAHSLLADAKDKLSYGRQCGRDQVCALGTIANWETFRGLLTTAKQVTKWISKGEIPSSFLHQCLDLHLAWSDARRRSPEHDTAPCVRYRPLLYYQIQRNLKPGPAAEWAHSLLRPASAWPWVNFIIRYAMLAAERNAKEE